MVSFGCQYLLFLFSDKMDRAHKREILREVGSMRSKPLYIYSNMFGAVENTECTERAKELCVCKDGSIVLSRTKREVISKLGRDFNSEEGYQAWLDSYTKIPGRDEELDG